MLYTAASKNGSHKLYKIHKLLHSIRMILVLGYWVLGDICRYCIVLLCNANNPKLLHYGHIKVRIMTLKGQMMTLRGDTDVRH